MDRRALGRRWRACYLSQIVASGSRCRAIPGDLGRISMDEGGLAWDDSSNNRAFLSGSIVSFHNSTANLTDSIVSLLLSTTALPSSATSLPPHDHRYGYHHPGASPKVCPAVWPYG